MDEVTSEMNFRKPRRTCWNTVNTLFADLPLLTMLQIFFFPFPFFSLHLSAYCCTQICFIYMDRHRAVDVSDLAMNGESFISGCFYVFFRFFNLW